jgi:hypothetical protein
MSVARLLMSACLFASATTARADVVYNSMIANQGGGGLIEVLTDISPAEASARVELPGGFENQSRVGQAIAFAGVARLVTGFDVPVTAFNDGELDADVTLSLFTNASGAPGTTLWTGTAVGVHVARRTAVTVSFAPHVVVPDEVFFALTYDNITDPTRPFGAYLSTAAPSVGSSVFGVLAQDSTTLAWSPELGLPPTTVLQARVTAVPAPSGAVCMVGSVIGAGLARRRRRA